MARVSDLFFSRWRSGRHVGAARPQIRVYWREGTFHRAYWPWTGPDDFDGVTIPGESKLRPWSAVWTGPSAQGKQGAFAAWQEIPGVKECQLEQDFDENGLNRLTLIVENQALQPAVGPLGAVFHVVKRGFLAPWKNFMPIGRPSAWQVDHDVPVEGSRLWGQREVRIDQGYGDQMVTTFKGVVDDLDYTARPGRMTLAARDFGQVLVDERVVFWNKSHQLHDPIVFVNRDKALERRLVGSSGPIHASSSRNGYPARFAADGDSDTQWHSKGHTAPGVTEWNEIVLNEPGSYDAIRLDLPKGGEEVYIGIFAHHFDSGAPPTRNGQVISGGWVSPGQGGQGYVPGTDGGWPYIRRLPSGRTGPTYYLLGATYRLGPGSRIRVGYRNLQKAGDGLRRAQVRELKGQRRVLPDTDEAKEWILTRDISDVVRVVLRWAGFKEWIVEDTGVGLPDRLVINRGDFYIDVINKLKEITGYVFFMGDPSGPESMGVPIWRQASALREDNAPEFETGAPKPMRQIRDRDLLRDASAKYSDSPLSYLIRIRGANATKKEGGVVSRSRETDRRFEANYYPPWTTRGRMVGFLKYYVRTITALKTQDDCFVACLLTALQQALASVTTIVEIPCNPELCLDDHVYLVEENTGAQTRLWIASRSSTQTTGEDAKWQMTVGGSLIDTPDVVDIKSDIDRFRRIGKGPPPRIPTTPLPTTTPETVEPIVA